MEVLTSLQRLSVFDNNMTGDVPTGIQKMPQLKEFEVASNKFTYKKATIVAANE